VCGQHDIKVAKCAAVFAQTVTGGWGVVFLIIKRRAVLLLLCFKQPGATALIRQTPNSSWVSFISAPDRMEFVNGEPVLLILVSGGNNGYNRLDDGRR
jgi:hypothetical protein